MFSNWTPGFYHTNHLHSIRASDRAIEEAGPISKCGLYSPTASIHLLTSLQGTQEGVLIGVLQVTTHR